MIFYHRAAFKPYSFGYLLNVNPLIPCDFALPDNKPSICIKTST